MRLVEMIERINDDLRGTGWHAFRTPAPGGNWYLHAECRSGHVAELEEPEIIESFVADVRAGGGGCLPDWCDDEQ